MAVIIAVNDKFDVDLLIQKINKGNLNAKLSDIVNIAKINIRPYKTREEEIISVGEFRKDLTYYCKLPGQDIIFIPEDIKIFEILENMKLTFTNITYGLRDGGLIDLGQFGFRAVLYDMEAFPRLVNNIMRDSTYHTCIVDKDIMKLY